MPSIIRMLYYIRRPMQKVALTKKNILLRDNYTCQYCGLKGERMMTVDHVHPRSKGGPSTWENLVCACTRCNNRKNNRTPEHANMLAQAQAESAEVYTVDTRQTQHPAGRMAQVLVPLQRLDRRGKSRARDGRTAPEATLREATLRGATLVEEPRHSTTSPSVRNRRRSRVLSITPFPSRTTISRRRRRSLRARNPAELPISPSPTPPGGCSFAAPRPRSEVDRRPPLGGLRRQAEGEAAMDRIAYDRLFSELNSKTSVLSRSTSPFSKGDYPVIRRVERQSLPARKLGVRRRAAGLDAVRGVEESGARAGLLERLRHRRDLARRARSLRRGVRRRPAAACEPIGQTGDKRVFDAKHNVRVIYDRDAHLREVNTRSREGLHVRINFPRAS